jgi:Arc/MetJ-type ribon-helix-helix transcriptional regulator
MNRLTLRLDHDQHRALRARVKRDRTSASQIVRDALVAHLGGLNRQEAIAAGMATMASQHAGAGALTLDAIRAENAQLISLVRELLMRIDGAAEVTAQAVPDPRADRLIGNLIARNPAKE